MIEWIDSQQVKDIAVLLEAQLEQSNWLAFDESLTIKAKDWWRITHPDLPTEAFD